MTPATHPASFTPAFGHLAAYNQWMNRKLYNAAAALPDEALMQDRGAFFGSLFGTLSHLVVADTIWLQRLAQHPPGFAALQGLAALPQPTALDQLPCANLAELTERRALLDDTLAQFCAELQPAQLAEPFDYASTKGVRSRKVLGEVLQHIFNHQTHHRGQASTLFSQMGIDIGATDLLLLLPNVA